MTTLPGTNVTRQTIPETDPSQLSTGYSLNETAPTNFSVPACGIEDIDKSVYRLFDKDLGFVTRKINGSSGPIDIKKPVVIFATGERFAVVKKLKPVRDRNGALLLPAISIRRTSLEQTYDDMNARGINQTTGELIIKRQLSAEDRDYQNLVNKLSFKHLQPLPSSSRGESKKDLAIQEGMYLDPKLGNNIFEFIAIPQPQYITTNYEIVFWTTHTEHMNYMIETMLISQLPQDKTFKLVTENGYWFLGYVDETINMSDNFDEFSEEKRLVRVTFNMKVKGYLVGMADGVKQVPIKRYFSAPTITFETHEGSVQLKKNLDKVTPAKEQDKKFILSDLAVDPEQQQKPKTIEKFLFKKEFVNPLNGKKKIKYVKAVTNPNGETVYTTSDRETMLEFLFLKNK